MQPFKARGYRVEAKTRAQVRAYAAHAREVLGCTTGAPDLARILEHRLHELGVTYHIESKGTMGDAEALTFAEDKEIWIREDIYEALLRNEGHARFTIAHEIGHLWMHAIPAAALAFRAEGGHAPSQDTEVQADIFAAEFLMPAGEIMLGCRTADDVARRYNVSIAAAIRRVRELQAEGLMRR